jgi:hypothetical protein
MRHDGDEAPAPPGVDVSIPSPARMWNYLQGGKDNFAADRAAAQQAARALPSAPAIARLARAWQADVVRRLAALGVRQFLDIGTGIPAAGSVHEVAQAIAPASRVVYVDNDPLVLAHARALLASAPQGSCAYLHADLRDPGPILAGAAAALDLARPTAIVLTAVLHFLTDAEDPWAVTARLLAGITGDAFLAVIHAGSDLSPAQAAVTEREYNARSPVPITFRTRAQVAGFFDGMQLLDPGLVPLAQWPAAGLKGSKDAALTGGHGDGYAGLGRRAGTAPPADRPGTAASPPCTHPERP